MPFAKGGIVVEEYRKTSEKVPVIVLVVFNIESGETSMNTTRMDVNIYALQILQVYEYWRFTEFI